MTDLATLRTELDADPERFGYLGMANSQRADTINALRYFDVPAAGVGRLRSRGECLGLGTVTATDIKNALALVIAPPVVTPPQPDPEPPPPVVTPPVVTPPPATPGTALATMRVIGSGAPASTVVTEYAQVFPRGAVPAGGQVGVTDAAGAALPSQFDARAHWDDGSVFHGALAFVPPPIAAGAVVELRQVARAAMAGSFPYSSAAVAVTLTSSLGTWTFTAAAATPTDVWRDGPLVRERRYTADVPASVVRTAGMRLVLDVTEASDGAVTVGLALRNDRCLRADTVQAEPYAVSVRIGSAERFRADVPTQQIFSAFVRQVRTYRDGAAAIAMPTVRPDVARLAGLGVVPRLDTALAIPAAYLDTIRAEMSAPAWQTPLGPRGVTQYMPMTGGRSDIGPVPGWVAAWLISGDPDALRHAHGRSEAVAACPWHYWDGDGWLTDDKHPGLWADADGRDSRWAPRYVGGSGAWTPEGAHDPEAHGALYACTGRRTALDGLLAHAAWCVMVASPGYVRRHGTGEPGAGLLLVQTQQARACAWALRTVATAAQLAVGAADREYFGRVIAVNLSYLRSAQAGPFVRGADAWMAASGFDAALGECTGYVPCFVNGDPALIPTWQHDFVGMVIARIALMDRWIDARPVAAWLARWSAERFLRSDMSPVLGCAYGLPVLTASTQRITTWAATQAEATRLGIPHASWAANDGNDYPANALTALTMLRNVFPTDARLRQAWEVVAAAPAASLRPEARQAAPQFSATLA